MIYMVELRRQRPWPKEFEEIVRQFLPDLGHDAVLTPDLILSDHGFTSIEMVGLVTSIEDAFGTILPDEALAPATFATPATLWNTLMSVLPDEKVLSWHRD
jgi:acyl carrier protein